MLGTATFQENTDYVLQGTEIRLRYNLYTLEKTQVSIALHLVHCICFGSVLFQYILVSLKCIEISGKTNFYSMHQDPLLLFSSKSWLLTQCRAVFVPLFQTFLHFVF